MTEMNLASPDASAAAVDVLIVGLKPNDSGVTVVGLTAADKALKASLESAFAAVDASGKSDATTSIPGVANLSARRVVGVGLGTPVRGASKGRRYETLRSAAGSAVRAAGKASTVAVSLPATDAEGVAAIAQGALLGAYGFTRFRSGEPAVTVSSIDVLTPLFDDRDAKLAVERARIVAERVDLTRDLVNTPPSHLSPAVFADLAVAEAKIVGLEIEVLDEKQLRKGGYGGLVGVGQGSVNPPRLVRLAYRPRGAKKHLALVGKGVTFDSGGLSLKPPQAMEAMKSDMAGAAAVLAAILSIAQHKTKVNVTAYLAMVENMPSGTAQRPSDVITIRGGKTVEVLNTDAEGRLILADALVRASEDKPDVVIDVATLTGAQMVALGNRYAAAMSNDDATRSAVVDAAGAAGELMWPMPLPAELRAGLDSPVADLKNIGDRYGGMLSAGLFLQEFVPDELPWVHLDIAGPSFNETAPHGYTGKGGTGYAVRTLVEYAERLSAK